MRLFDPIRSFIASVSIGLMGAALSCSSADSGRSPKGDATESGGQSGDEDAATGVAGLSSSGTGGRAGGARGSGGKAHSGSGGESGIPDGAGDSCNAIVACVQACPDDPCAQACADKGSPAAKELLNALLDCGDLNGCSDGECLRMNCASEIAACASDGPPSGGKNDGGPPTGGGAIPPELVGKWANSDQSLTYEFKADGTYTYDFHYGSSLTCIAYLSQRITEVGTFSVQGDTLTTMGTSRRTDTQDCSYKSTSDTGAGKTQSYIYMLSGNTLTLTSSNGSTSTLTEL